MRGGKKDYFVCKVSGYTSETEDKANCVDSTYETIQ